MAAITSIIIPVCGAHEVTRECLVSIASWTQNYEIIIIDNGSEEPVPFKGDLIRTLRNDKNRGFAAAANRGADVARGEFLCILNNDTVVTPAWLEFLLHKILRKRADIVGPRTNVAAGRQAVRLPIYDGVDELDAAARRFCGQYRDQIEYVRWIVGVCMVMRRDTFCALGGFDERYGLGNGEDIDLCYAAHKKGLRIAIARDIYIHHIGSLTHRLLDIDARKLRAENHERFRQKWGVGYEEFEQEIKQASR